jgi:hypothetical protein
MVRLKAHLTYNFTLMDESSHRIVTVQRNGRWAAQAQDAAGRPFGIECAGATEQDAVGRLSRWLEWQRAHAAALVTLQEAQRAHHRVLAVSAFAGPTAGPLPLETQQESLAAVEAARVRLDAIRERQPE